MAERVKKREAWTVVRLQDGLSAAELRHVLMSLHTALENPMQESASNSVAPVWCIYACLASSRQAALGFQLRSKIYPLLRYICKELMKRIWRENHVYTMTTSLPFDDPEDWPSYMT